MVDGPETFRDHFLSVYQSAAAEVARRCHERELDGPPGAAASATRGARLPQSIEKAAADAARRHLHAHRRGAEAPPGATPVRDCAELGLQFLEAKIKGDTAAVARLADAFTAGTCDPAWATTLAEYARFFGPNGTRRAIPYIRPADAGEQVIAIKAGAKIALVADWGTGAGPAVQILSQISALAPDIFIHLGDIYYSGTPKECDIHFQKPIAAALGNDRSKVPVYSLSGNHDMYCGGAGYYPMIASLNPDPLKQPASYFCLRSSGERWQLLAMDTGLNDFSPMNVADVVTYLEPDELDWLCRRVSEFEGRTILLSHHQLFSAFSPIGPAQADGKRSATNPKLAAAFARLNADGKIAAWFWGHEHNLCVYDAFGGLTRGRCIGHGAVPVFANDDVYAPVEGLSEVPGLIQNTKLKKTDTVWAHGFAFLTLGSESVPSKAEYFQSIDGQPSLVFSEEIE